MALARLLPFKAPASAPRSTRTGWETIPRDLSRAELFRYFTYTAEDRAELFACRGTSNKPGLAILFGGLRLTGRFLTNFEALPQPLLSHVCAQLKVAGRLCLDYPQRQATRYEHVERLKAYLGLQTFVAEQHGAVVTKCVQEQVRTGIAPAAVYPVVEEHLRAQTLAYPA